MNKFTVVASMTNYESWQVIGPEDFEGTVTTRLEADEECKELNRLLEKTGDPNLAISLYYDDIDTEQLSQNLFRGDFRAI